MDKIRARKFASLEYGDPHDFLRELRKVEAMLTSFDIPEKVRRLRTSGLKSEREMRDAALFCVGMDDRFNLGVRFAATEDEDFDFVATWRIDDVQHFCPVQLKEVAPEDLNPQSSMEDVLRSLAKYRDQRDLTIAIRLSRTTSNFDPVLLDVPKHFSFAQLWMFGCVSVDQSTWAVWGDFMDISRRPIMTTFQYPAG